MKILTPLKAIRKKCIDCSAGSLKEVKNCPCCKNESNIQECPLYPYRTGQRPKEKQKVGPVKSIRKYCFWCCGGSKKLIRICLIKDCSLYPFRFGKNPNRVKDKLKMPFLLKRSIVEKEENF